VVRLVNRRFVPFYFDLLAVEVPQGRGAARDLAARRFVLRARPDLGALAVSTPPVLIMTLGGEVLAEIRNYASEEEMLRELRAVLERNSVWNQLSADEKHMVEGSARGEAAAQVAFAELALDLRDLDEAEARFGKVLAALPPGELRDRAAYLRGHAARLRGDRRTMEEAFAEIDDEDAFARDVATERAQDLFAHREIEQLNALLATMPESSSQARASELRYLEGLGQFHLGEKEKAAAIWRALIAELPEDRWVMRADWALFNLTNPGKRSFTTADPKTPLGRLGYMRRVNPDLTPAAARSGVQR
jgi:hypothetical protein